MTTASLSEITLAVMLSWPLLQPETSSAQAAAASNVVPFVCDDESTLTIEFIKAKDQAKVTHGTSTWVLPRVRSGSGARYAAKGVSAWNKGNDVRFEHGGTTLNCTAKK